MNTPFSTPNLTLFLSAALISQSSLSAETPDTTAHEVIVWGTQVSSSSIILDSEAMAIRQADHISSLLRPIPGVDVGGAHSLNQRITIRSMDDKDLRISIDGANQNTYMYHHMGNLQIHADILKSVDVQVGNNSVVNGGLGGVVRFETKEARDLLRPGQRFGARAQARVASNASNNYALSLYGQVTDAVDVLGYYNFVDRRNFRVGGGDILDGDHNVVPNTDGKVRGLEGELTDLLLKAGWNLSDNQRLKIGFETYKDQGDYSYRPDMGLATDLAIAETLEIPLVYPTEFTRDTWTLNYDLTWGENSTLRTALFRNESTMWRDERGLESWRPQAATINQGEAENSGFNLLATTDLQAGITHQLTYGIDLIRYKTAYYTDNSFRSGEEATHSAAFLENRMELGSVALIPGVRYDHYDSESAVVEDSFSNISLALAAEYEVTPQLLLSASITQLFKGPELSEVFTGAGLGSTPNPDIKAETGNNAELAVAYVNGGFSSGITLFRTLIKDYIFEYAPNPDPDIRSWQDNIGDMTIEGYEAYLEYQYQGWRALLTYASAESELSARDGYADLDGARIDRQQGDSVTFALSYHLDALNVALHWDWQWVDDLPGAPDLDGADLENSKAGYSLHNISARWTPRGALNGFEFTLGVDNLFDEFYASQSSRTGMSRHPLFGDLYLMDYEPGRNIKATLAYQF